MGMMGMILEVQSNAFAVLAPVQIMESPADGQQYPP